MSFIKSEYSDGFFNVNQKNGFLPEKTPLEILPDKYSKLQILLDRMPVKLNGKSGYLDIPGKIKSAIDSLPNFISEVSIKTDIRIIKAQVRGYSF